LDNFGISVALDGDTAIIGANNAESSPYWNCGAAYVFTRTAGVWTVQARLLASDGYDGDYFGESVTLDGDTAIIGAWHDIDERFYGSAYVFNRTGGVWTEQVKLQASDCIIFGSAVALDGDTAVIGAYGHYGTYLSSAYVFVRTGDVWTMQAKLLPADGANDDNFGYAVAVEGDTVAVGAPWDDDNGDYSGSAYVFTRTDGVWSEQAKLLSSDGAPSEQGFGWSVAVEGDTALVGAPQWWRCTAYVFRLIPPDADGDGIDDGVDFCLDTIIPESVPTNCLGVNRWALVDDDGMFDTTPPPGGGGGPDFDFSVADTGGCSCEQIIEAADLGWGHTKFGCSTGAMLQWINDRAGFAPSPVEIEVQQASESALQHFTESVSERSASPSGATADSESRRRNSLIRDRTYRRDNDNK
jgi:hypothetical protein